MSASPVSSAPSLPPVQLGANSKFVYLHPDDVTPMWKLFLIKITQLVLTLLFPIGVILASHAILSVTFNAIFLPFIAFGAVFSSAFMFASTDVKLIKTERINP